MAHFDEVLPGRVHRVIYEDMVDDTEGEVRRLLDYCGLPFEDAVPALLREPARGAHRKLRAGAPADLSRRRRPLAPLRAMAGAAEGGARAGARSRIPPTHAGERRRLNAHLIKPRQGRGDMHVTRKQQHARKAVDAGAVAVDGGDLPRLRLDGLGADRGAGAADGTRDDRRATPQQRQDAVLSTITVTSQKRTENLQKVPISIQVLGEEKLKQQDVADFDDYAKLIPSLSYSAIGGGVFSGPGFAQVYMRGVASGGDGNHSGSQPSVGMYLDEQPITTIQGALDIHIYDVARIEALAGPQGTLYGASSQAGTVRIITNKPDPSGFAAGYAVEANAIDGGGIGHVVEGFVNAPLGDSAAIRLVGWEKHDAGYIDNVLGTRTFPTSGMTIDNADLVDDDYNWARHHRRPRRAEDRPQRQLVDDADDHGPAARRRTAAPATTRGRRPGGAPILSRSAPTTAGCRRR